MADFFSRRFGRKVWVTNHARERMLRRGIDDKTLERVIEDGEVKHRDEMSMWIFAHIPNRTDNLICAAVVKQTALVVKTVMVNWELEDEV